VAIPGPDELRPCNRKYIFLLFLYLKQNDLQKCISVRNLAILFGMLTRITAEQSRTHTSISGKKKTPFYSPNFHVRFGAHPAPCSVGIGGSITRET